MFILQSILVFAELINFFQEVVSILLVLFFESLYFVSVFNIIWVDLRIFVSGLLDLDINVDSHILYLLIEVILIGQLLFRNHLKFLFIWVKIVLFFLKFVLKVGNFKFEFIDLCFLFECEIF